MSGLTAEQTKLIEDNHNLIYSFLHKYNLKIDDYYGIVAIAFCKAATSYNSNVSNFSTYSFRCMELAYFHHLRKQSAAKRAFSDKNISLYDVMDEDNNGNKVLLLDIIPGSDNTELEALSNVSIQEFLEAQQKREQKILELAAQGLTQKQIMSIVGISQPQVSRIISKMRKIFNNEYK